MGLFSHNKENVAPVSPMASVLGEHLFYLDGRGANLFVHENCVVIDRTKGGLMNLGNRTYKIIPFRYIVSSLPPDTMYPKKEPFVPIQGLF